MEEVREQTVGAPAGLAADALHADAIDLQTGEGLSLVGAPADQGVGGSTVGMRTAVGKRKEAPRERDGLGVVLGRMSVVLYNNHVGAPPFVVISGKIRPHREAFSFLASFSAIILPCAVPVNPIGLSRSFSVTSWPFNHFDRSASRSPAPLFNLAVIKPILTKECVP
jgi:hypothetical protein